MKTPVLFTCGHVFEIQLFGDPEDIEAQKQVMEAECLCPICLANKFGGFPMILFEKALEHAGKMNFPNLLGSFDQVKSALSIRSQMFFMPDDWIWAVFRQESLALRNTKAYAGRFSMLHSSILSSFPEMKEMETSHMWNLFFSEACLMRDATWWIDRNGQCARELANANLRRTPIGHNIHRDDADENAERIRKMIVADKTECDNIHQELSYPNSDLEPRAPAPETAMQPKEKTSNRKHVKSAKDRKRRK